MPLKIADSIVLYQNVNPHFGTDRLPLLYSNLPEMNGFSE